MDAPLFNRLGFFVLYYLALLTVSFLLAYVGGKRLPRDVPMGLIISLYIPWASPVYVYKGASLLYVLAFLVLGYVLNGLLGWWPSLWVVTALSCAVMYWRVGIRGEGLPSGETVLYTLAGKVDAATLARFNDIMAATGESRDELLMRAVAALPLEE